MFVLFAAFFQEHVGCGRTTGRDPAQLIDELPVHRPQDDLIPFPDDSKSCARLNLQCLTDFRRNDKLSFSAYCDCMFCHVSYYISIKTSYMKVTGGRVVLNNLKFGCEDR